MSANEWKLVPVEPTPEMVALLDPWMRPAAAQELLRKVIAAAPTAPAQAASGGEVVAPRGWVVRRNDDQSITITGPRGEGVVVHRETIGPREIPEEVLYALASDMLATPASAPPAGDPPAPAAAREAVEALRELLACHTESAGFTMSMAASKEDFAAFLDRQQARVDAAVAQARAALAAADAQRAQEGGK